LIYFFLGAFSVVSERVSIGNNVKIHHNVHIGSDVTIGDNTIIYSGANIADDSVIGANCIIHSNAVIGADGFGFSPNKDRSYSKIPQTGNVIIEDDVEVGAGTTIDRATLGSTIIRKGVKLDDGIAHVETFEHTGGEGANQWFRIILKEGRNREIRRLIESQNLKVSRLIRTRYGPLNLPSHLKRGQFMEIEKKNLEKIFKMLGMS